MATMITRTLPWGRSRGGEGRGARWAGALGWWGLGMAASLPLLAALQRYPNHSLLLVLGLPVVAGAALLVIYRPGWGACALILLTYWNASDVLTETFGFSWLLRLAMAGVIAAWLLDRWARPRAVPLRWPLLGPLLLWGGAQVLASATAVSPAVAGARLLEYAKALVIFFLVVNILATPRWWRWGINALLAAVGLLSLPVLYQGLSGSHFTFWGFGAMEYANISPGRFGWRLAGAIGDPNFLAMVLVAALPLAAVQALEKGVGWGRRGFALGVLGLGLGATVFTYSRGAMLGVALLLAVLLVAHPRRRWVLTAAIAGVLLATALAPQALWGRLNTLVESSLLAPGQQMTDASFRNRRHEMLTGVLMFRHHPLLGVGPGNFETEYLKYSAMAGLTGEDTVRDPHSLYTQLAAETGVVGLAAFAWLMISAFGLLERARRQARRLAARNFAWLLAGCEMSLAAYLLMSAFLHDAFFRNFFLLLALSALGSVLALEASRQRAAAAGASRDTASVQEGI